MTQQIDRDEMPCIQERKDERVYNFRCPACEDEGELRLDTLDLGGVNSRLECPAGCGAVFMEYKALTRWVLRCVVRPVFARATGEQR